MHGQSAANQSLLALLSLWLRAVILVVVVFAAIIFIMTAIAAAAMFAVMTPFAIFTA